MAVASVVVIIVHEGTEEGVVVLSGAVGVGVVGECRRGTEDLSLKRMHDTNINDLH